MVKSHVVSTIAACTTLLAGCDSLKPVEKGSIRLSDTVSFNGLSALAENDDGTMTLKWRELPASDVVYHIYQRPFDGTYDFSKPLKSTRENSYTTEDLRFTGRRCFTVKVERGGVLASTTLLERCSQRERAEFLGIESLSPEADGSLELRWKAFVGENLVHQVHMASTVAALDSAAPVASTTSGTWRSDPLALGVTRCFKVTLVRGGQDLTSSKALPKCNQTEPLAPFAGVKAARAVDEGQVEVTWERAGSGEVTGYRVYEGSNFKNVLATLPATATRATLSGLDPNRQYILGVRAVGGDREDDNKDITSVQPRTGTRPPEPGTPTRLRFFAQPSLVVTAGTLISAQPQVEVIDTYGLRSADADNGVALSAFLNEDCTVPASSVMAVAVNPVPAVSGLAGFTGVTFTQARAYYLKASSPGLVSACSNAIQVLPATATRLAFTQALPATAQAGVALAAAPQVEIQDAMGNRVGSALNNVALAAYADSECTLLSSTPLLADAATVAAVAGTSSFTRVRYTRAETIYLGAASTGLASACVGPLTVVPVAPTRLAFKMQPSSLAIVGRPLPVQPQVEIQDTYGNWVQTATATVTLSLHADSACTVAATGLSAAANPLLATSGVAAFSGIKVEPAQTAYLQASAPGLLSKCSDAIVLIDPVPARLSLFVQPSGINTVNYDFSTPPWVEIQDATGNRAATANDPVTLAAFSDSACSVPVAGLTVAQNPVSASSGIASFSGLRFSGVATIHLKATSGTLQSVCSRAVNVIAATPVKLGFSVQPASNAVSSVPLGVQPGVEILDAASNRVTTGSHSVTIAAYSDTACSVPAVGTLANGATAVVSSTGLAAFSGLAYNKAETIYLKASAAGLADVCSAPVQVAAGAAARLAFFLQPSANGTVGNPFNQQPQVMIQDADGNWVSNASNSISVAAFSDAVCTVAAGGILGFASNPVGAASGNASFAGIKYSQVGVIHLQASATGLAPACSGAVSVSAPAPVRLRFSQTPSVQGLLGTELVQQPRVEVQDGSGNRETAAAVPITLTAHTDIGCGSAAVGRFDVLENPLTSSFGLSIFSGLKYWQAGRIHIKASSPGLIQDCSPAIDISAVTPTRVAFAPLPSSTANVDAELGVQPGVFIQDASGNIARHSTLAVALSAHTDANCQTAASGNLSATNNGANAVEGALQFSGVRYSQTGNIYLRAAASGLDPACSPVLSVNAASIFANLSNTPAAVSADNALNVSVGGTGVVDYAHQLIAADHSCAGLTFSTFRSVGTPITDALPTDGVWTLCVKGRDAASLVQAVPTRYRWVRDTAPPTAVLGNVPADPSSDTALNVNVSGTDVHQYRYGVIAGPVCTGFTYSSWYNVSTPIADAVPGTGQHSLCVQGRDVAGNTQSTPTLHTWTVTSAWPPVGVIVSASVDGDSVRLFWRPGAAGVGRVIAYQTGTVPPTTCAQGTVIPKETVGAGQTYQIDGLLPQTDYAFRVCDDDGVTVSAGLVAGTRTWPAGMDSSVICDTGDLVSTSSICQITTVRDVVREGVTIYSPGHVVVSAGGQLGFHGTNADMRFNMALQGDLTVSGTLRGNLGTVLAQNINVTATGVITARGLGHAGVPGGAGQGPGAGAYYNGLTEGWYVSGGGGGNGGMGSTGFGNTGGHEGVTYSTAYGETVNDSPFTPTSRGSSGGGATCAGSTAAGGNGGGALKLVAVQTATISGLVSAQGDNSVLTAGVDGTRCGTGGGAGGSIWIDAAVLAGGGVISADGGNANSNSYNRVSGAGGGGRVALWYSSSSFSGQGRARGGVRSHGAGWSGGAGSVFSAQKNVTSTLMFENGNVGLANSAPSRLNLAESSGMPSSGVGHLHITGTSRVIPFNVQSGLMFKDFTVSAGASFDVDGQGHSGANLGPGGSSTTAGSHGGLSGRITNSALDFYTKVYGNPYAPTMSGSTGRSGFASGGAMKLTISGTAFVNGNISARGLSVGNDPVGLGSGGSIWFAVNELAGSGTIDTSGGTSTHGGGVCGGGGRVAVTFDTNTFLGTISSNGNVANCQAPNRGGAGTVFLSQRSGLNKLIVESPASLSLLDSAPTPIDLSQTTGLPNATLDELVIQGEGQQVVFLGTQTSLVIKKITLGPGARINQSHLGYVGTSGGDGQGPSGARFQGTGCSTSNGGGNGGNGGIGGGNVLFAGVGTGDPFTPTHAGSAGAYCAAGQTGLRGGGALKLVVDDEVRIDGTIELNGLGRAGAGAGAAGGGGTLWLDTALLSGSGNIQANGGESYWGHGAGGGGRVALHYNTSTFTGVVRTAGGTGYSGGLNNGGAGTAFFNQKGVHRKLVVSNHNGSGALDGAHTPLNLSGVADLNEVEISHGAVAYIAGPQSASFVIRNLRIGAGARLTADALGHAGGAVQSNGAGGATGGRGSASGGGGGGGGGAGGASGGGDLGGSIASGDADAPMAIGGGGGGGHSAMSRLGGAGAGAIRLEVDGVLTIDGAMTANGVGVPIQGSGCGTCGTGGGGAGGSLWLIADEIAGAGTIEAKGGDGGTYTGTDPRGGGGGGGGRVSLSVNQFSFTGSVSVSGGAGGSTPSTFGIPGNPGSPGTRRRNGADF